MKTQLSRTNDDVNQQADGQVSEVPAGVHRVASNRVREFREELLMTRKELARRAGISLRTIWSTEKGSPCRVLTKRKILRALGVPTSEHRRVFPDG